MHKHTFVTKQHVLYDIDGYYRFEFTTCTKCYKQTTKVIEPVEL